MSKTTVTIHPVQGKDAWQPEAANLASSGLPSPGIGWLDIGLEDEAGLLPCCAAAAEGGTAEAAFHRASHYEDSRGFASNDAGRHHAVSAAKWHHRAAVLGHAAAQRSLGMLYLKGRGVAADPAWAAVWLRRAAEGGDTVAQCNLGLLYRQGLGVARDEQESLAWFLLAAGRGQEVAQYNAALQYLEGSGAARDAHQAEHWLKRSAEQGYGPAQYMLAWIYAGRGSEDAAESFDLLRSAAAQGEPRALFALGLMAASHEGVSPDLPAASAFLTLSAERGCEEAVESLRELQSGMTAAEIARGRELAAAWTSTLEPATGC